MSLAAELYLIRHGETAWSRSGRHTGTTDIALTAHGEDEARALKPVLQRVKFAHVLSSPRQRALRTCELTESGPIASIEPDLAEWDYGDYEGKTSSEIRATRRDWSVFRDGCPGGETTADIFRRADRLIARLVALEGKIALFSHGQFLMVLAARWIGLPVIEAQHFQLGTASLSVLGHNPSHPHMRVIALWNAVPPS
jgi:probable phosphoglycerate mutase